jgi:hypothetical protein
MYQPTQQPDPNKNYYPPPPELNQAYNPNQTYPDQAHLEYGQSLPPQYGNAVAPPPPQEGGQPTEKIKPASGWNDIWATILWLLNVGAFIGLAVVGLRTYKSHRGVNGVGVQSENAYPGLTFDTSTFKIFGLSAVVGFGISFLYLILAQMFPRPLIIVTFIGSIIVYFGVTIYYFVQHYYSAAIVFLIFACLYAACFFWWRSRIPFATG